MRSTIFRLLMIVIAVAAIIFLYTSVIPSVNHTTIALTFLLVPLVAGTYGFVSGIWASLLCAFCFNFFFLPPIGTLTIHDPQNFVAFAVFLITALTANQLSSTARKRTQESESRREELSKLYEVSRVIIKTPDPETAATILSRRIVDTFQLHACIIAVPDGHERWNTIAQASGNSDDASVPPIPDSVLQKVNNSGQLTQMVSNSGNMITSAPLRVGDKVTGALVCFSDKAEPATIEALAGLVALALERVRFLKELSKTEALRQSDQLKSAILASVSHDLRTPLTSIQAAIDNLLSTDVEWQEASEKEFHMIIKEEADRMGRLVRNLLEMARIESGECRPLKDWRSVSDMFSDVLERCAELLSHHQVTIDVPPDFPLVFWDEKLIGQAVTNLMENAAIYSLAGSEIALRAERNQALLLIHVEDQGIGVPAEELPRIFHRFYRGESAKKNHSGSGMGLAIARGIVEAHGGTITAKSIVGSGTTFTIALPVEMKNV